jgi:hypothetical protein
MKTIKTTLCAAAAALCLAGGTARAAGDDLPFEVLVDPALNAAELPAAPSPADRVTLLQTLGASHPICPTPDQHVAWRENLFRSLDALPLTGSSVDGMAHIVLTERQISGQLLLVAVDYLASRGTPQADARVVQIYKAAPILAKRMVPDGIDAATRPLAENSNVADIRSQAERTAQADGSRALVKALGGIR